MNINITYGPVAELRETEHDWFLMIFPFDLYFHIPIRVNIENCQTPLLNNLKTYTAKFTKFGDGNRSKGVLRAP